MKKPFGEYVKNKRTELGLSTTDVQRRSSNSISASYVTRIENEPLKNISLPKIVGLAKGLGVTVIEILYHFGINQENTVLPYEKYLQGLDDLPPQDLREIEICLQILMYDIQRRLTKKLPF